MIKPYRIDIEQGHPIETEKLSQVKPGMPQEEVIYLLGHPTIQDHFHPNRFDYVYDLKKNEGVHKHQHVIIYFEGDRVQRVVNS